MAILGKRPSFSHSREEAMQALFAKELSVLKEAEGAFARHPPPEELEHYCEMLAEHYRSMLAQMMKLTSISDATQLQLKRTKLDLSSALSNVERLNRNLEAVSQEKDEILALAAHDLRSPLSGIRGLADLIVEESESAPGEIHSYAREIVNVADDTLEMIRDILDIYRLDGGTVDGQTAESIRISDLLSEAADISRANALRKRITMVIESVNADRAILIEKPLVVRILENLVSNALKYSPRESTVTVRIDIEGKFLHMIVRDQGPGLSEADQAKLFKKFARLASRPTGGESSIGLGLAIVDRIVQHLGGRVWVETIHGRGATFKVELPVTVVE
ncbi:MAG: HAMP domain-containing histidine kinase [Cupriavidus sp.]|nr:MAG: HAMP domain-containing histidine kinase [Cupriavidus sp.]